MQQPQKQRLCSLMILNSISGRICTQSKYDMLTCRIQCLYKVSPQEAECLPWTYCTVTSWGTCSKAAFRPELARQNTISRWDWKYCGWQKLVELTWLKSDQQISVSLLILSTLLPTFTLIGHFLQVTWTRFTWLELKSESSHQSDYFWLDLITNFNSSDFWLYYYVYCASCFKFVSSGCEQYSSCLSKLYSSCPLSQLKFEILLEH